MSQKNMITFNVSNGTGTALPLSETYTIDIQVANSAGIGYSVGDISISK